MSNENTTTYIIGEKGKEFEVQRGDKVHYTDKKGETTNYYFLDINDELGACELIRVYDDEERNFEELEEKVDAENYRYESPEILKEGWVEPDFDEEQYETYEEARANMKNYAKKQKAGEQFEKIWQQFIRSNPHLFKDPKFVVGALTLEQRNNLYRRMKSNYFRQAGLLNSSANNENNNEGNDAATGAGAGAGTSASSQVYESPAEKEKRECREFIASHGIREYKDFGKWASKGGHPNKGGDQKLFQKVSDCFDKTLKKDYENKKNNESKGKSQKGGVTRRKKSMKRKTRVSGKNKRIK